MQALIIIVLCSNRVQTRLLSMQQFNQVITRTKSVLQAFFPLYEVVICSLEEARWTERSENENYSFMKMQASLMH